MTIEKLSKEKLEKFVLSSFVVFKELVAEEEFIGAKLFLEQILQKIDQLMKECFFDDNEVKSTLQKLQRSVTASDAEWETLSGEFSRYTLKRFAFFVKRIKSSDKKKVSSKKLYYYVGSSLGLGCLLAGVIVLIAAQIPLHNQRLKNIQALREMHEIARIINTARDKVQGSLESVTGKNCSFCPCRRNDVLLDMLADNDVCVQQWKNVLTSALEEIGTYCTDKYVSRLTKDPWGSPYLLNENTGELFSAGPDRRYGTNDDIRINLLQTDIWWSIVGMRNRLQLCASH